MFEKASRLKLRFNTNKGVLSAEDLWDLTLTELDTLFVELNKGLKESGSEGLLKKRATKADKELDLRIAIVSRVFEVKNTEKEDAATRADQKAERERLIAIKAQRAEKAELELSDEELDTKIAATYGAES